MPRLRGFEGHFPGSPLLPGVVQVHMAVQLARRSWGNVDLVGLQSVKFRAPVVPGPAPRGPQPWQRLRVRLFPAQGEGEVKFDLTREEVAQEPEPSKRELDTVAEGVLKLVPAGSAVVPQPGPEPPAVPVPPQPPVESLLPHRAPATFLLRALALGATDDDESWFAGAVPPEHALANGGRVSPLAAIELAAQGAACIGAMRGHPRTAPPIEAMLVGVREATFHAPDFGAGEELVAAVRTRRRAPFLAVTARVGVGDRLLAEATLQIAVK